MSRVPIATRTLEQSQRKRLRLLLLNWATNAYTKLRRGLHQYREIVRCIRMKFNELSSAGCVSLRKQSWTYIIFDDKWRHQNQHTLVISRSYPWKSFEFNKNTRANFLNACKNLKSVRMTCPFDIAEGGNTNQLVAWETSAKARNVLCNLTWHETIAASRKRWQ